MTLRIADFARRPELLASEPVQRILAARPHVLVLSHRWEVRGHWRSISGLGKDETGNYIVRGLTWVAAHEKGPEQARLVKKTRLIGGAE